MTESIRYISLLEASRLCSYSQDYLSLRARQGKLKARKIGRNWVTTKEWLDDYIHKVETLKNGFSGPPQRGKPGIQTSLPPTNLPVHEAGVVLERGGSFRSFGGVVVTVALLVFVVASLRMGEQGVLSTYEHGLATVVRAGETGKQVVLGARDVPENLGQLGENIGRGVKYAIESPTGFADSYVNFVGQTVTSAASLATGVYEQANDAVSQGIRSDISGISSGYKAFNRGVDSLFQRASGLFARAPEEVSEEPVFQEEPAPEEQRDDIGDVVVPQQGPSRDVVREVRVLDSSALDALRVQVAELLGLRNEIEDLHVIADRIQSHPPTIVNSTAPVYVGSTGIQVGGNGSFASLGVSGSAGIQNLGVGRSASFGGNSSDTFVVNSTASFASAFTVSASSTLGSLTVLGSTTLGDEAVDTVTFAASTLSVPNDLNIDSGTLFVDSANNRIGLGTTAPDNLLVLDDGSLAFSTGGGASDVALSRGAADRLDLALGDSLRIIGGQLQLDLDNSGSTQGIVFGTTADVNLYRTAADILATDDRLLVNASSLALDIQNTTDAASNLIAAFRGGNRATPANGDEGYLSFTVDDGSGSQQEVARLSFGILDVTTSSKDGVLTFSSEVNNTLTDTLYVRDGRVGILDSAPSTLLSLGGTGSGNGITFGDDGADSVNLYRSAANTLKTDGDLFVGGGLTVQGLTTSQGSIDLGDSVTDTITFVGVVDSNIVPESSSQYNFGSASKRWATGYFDTVDATNLSGTVTGGSTTSPTWNINSDNATANAEISTLAFETGSGNFNATLQWNASGDTINKVSGFDDTILANHPLAIYSEVSGGNQTFTSGTLFKYSQPAAHAITQSGAFIGVNLDFSSNITIPDSSSGNQTGLSITLKDGGASATSKAISLGGTLDTGIDLSGATIGTAAISLPVGTAAAQGIDFGGDVTLYRSAANELKSDDNLTVGLDITTGGTFRLNPASDRPLIVNQFDAFTSGANVGFGRWGLYQNSFTLVVGVPGTDYGVGTSSIKFSGWLVDSTRQDWVTIEEGGNVGIGTTDPDQILTIDDGSIGFSTGDGASDVVLSRGASDRLDLASGDSFNIVAGNITFGTASSISTATGTLSLTSADGIVSIGTGTGAEDVFSVNGGALVVRGDTGKVGIGTGSPDLLLTVNSPDANGLARFKYVNAATSHAAGWNTIFLNNTDSTDGNFANIGFTGFRSSDSAISVQYAAISGIFRDHTSVTGDLAFVTRANDVLAERVRITELGVGIGTTEPGSGFGGDPLGLGTFLDINGKTEGAKIRIIGAGSSISTELQVFEYSNSDDADLELFRARGTQASPLVIADGDEVGSVNTNAWDGSAWQRLSDINTLVDGAVGAGVPAEMLFKLSDSDGTLNTVVTFKSTGRVGIGTGDPDQLLVVDDGSIGLSTGGGASDVVLSRGAADRLDLASGDSFNIVSGGLTVGGTGTADIEGYVSIGNGSALNQNQTLVVDRTFTAQAANVPRSLYVAGTLTAAAGFNAALAEISGTLVEAGSGTHSIFSGLRVNAFTLTDGLADTTNAASIYIDAAPSGASNNYALWVDSGATQLDSTLAVGGTTTLTGNVGIGTAVNVSQALAIGSSLSGSGSLRALVLTPTFTATSGSSGIYAQQLTNWTVDIQSGNTHSLVAGLVLNAPTLTETSGSVTDFATLYIAGTTSAADNNYSLWVDGGISKFDGGVSTSTIVGDDATTVLSIVDSPTGVNYVQIGNSVAGSALDWTATGSDIGVTWDFNLKGSGAASLFRWYANSGSTQLGALTSGGQFQLPITGSSAGILIGGDTQLYRSAANVLTTPDQVDIEGYAAIGNGSAPGQQRTLIIDRDFTAAVGSSSSNQLLIRGIQTLENNQAASALEIAPSSVVVNSGFTHGYVASLSVYEPSITVTSGTVTDAVTFYIVSAPTEGASGNYALWVDSGATRLDGQLQMDRADGGTSATGIVFGSTADTNLYRSAADTLRTDDKFSAARIYAGASSNVDYLRHWFTGSFTSGGSSTVLIGQSFDGALTGASGDTNYFAGSNFNNTFTTQAAAETVGTIAQVRITEPFITIGTATVTNSASLYIEGAATEATNNYALWVDSGTTRFDGSVGIGTVDPSSFTLQVAGDIGPDSATTLTTTLTTVDSTATNTGYYNSIYCISSTDCKIAYYDNSNQDLKMADCDDATCSTKTVTTVDSVTSNNTGIYASIFCLATDDCKIAYGDSINADLLFVDCDDATCSSKTITTVVSAVNAGDHVSLYCVATDDCKIAYYDNTTQDLAMVDCDDATCSTKTVTTVDSVTSADTGKYTSIYCVATNDCKIAYQDVSSLNLMLADCDDATCSSKTLTTIDTTTTGYYTSIFCLATDDCKISYYDSGNTDLMMIDCGNATCSSKTTTTVDSTTSASTGVYTSIYCLSSTDCKISYQDATNTNLMMADCNDSACSSRVLTTVDSVTSSATGLYSSIFCLATDDCKIAYMDDGSTNDHTMMADCDTVDCAEGVTGFDLGSSSLPFANIYAGAFFGKSTVISSFDVAENYSVTDTSINAGDIVSVAFGGGLVVEKTTGPYQQNIIGIISTQPGITLAEWSDKDNPSKRPVALAGRVPVKVSGINGPIGVGDGITSSPFPGVGMKATQPGRIVGYAMGEFVPESPEQTGTIQVFVSLEFFIPPYSSDSTLGLSVLETTSSTSTVSGTTADALTSDFFKRLVEWFQGVTLKVMTLVANLIETKTIQTEFAQYKDRATGSIYCVWIENGEFVKAEGVCGESSSGGQAAQEQQAGGGSSGSELFEQPTPSTSEETETLPVTETTTPTTEDVVETPPTEEGAPETPAEEPVVQEPPAPEEPVVEEPAPEEPVVQEAPVVEEPVPEEPEAPVTDG